MDPSDLFDRWSKDGHIPAYLGSAESDKMRAQRMTFAREGDMLVLYIGDKQWFIHADEFTWLLGATVLGRDAP